MLAAVEFAMPTRDNLHLMDDVYVQVASDGAQGRASARPCGGRRCRIAGEHGRTRPIAWSHHLAGAISAPERVEPSTGVGHLPLDAGTLFAQSLGLRLAQVERQSRLLLPVDAGTAGRPCARRPSRGPCPTYEVVSWVGPTPEEHLDRVAEMNRTLSTDAPTGDLDWEQEAWDAERVRLLDERSHRTGYSVTTLAVQRPPESVAGLTRIHVHNAHPHRPEQWNTVVAAAHRGHRLGLLLKVGEPAAAGRGPPRRRATSTPGTPARTTTCSAINTRLGFRLHSVHGAWKA